jgi:prophage regulatory protein
VKFRLSRTQLRGKSDTGPRANRRLWQSSEIKLKHLQEQDGIVMRILRLKAVADKIGTSSRTVYNLINRSDFPRPISVGMKSVGWIESEIDNWLMARIDARDRELKSGAAK